MTTHRDGQLPFWPLFLDLDGRRALVLGRGEAAERRAASLLACGASLVRADGFEPALLDGCAIAIGAASEAERADADHPVQQALRAMSAEAARRGIPCNVIDQPQLSSFLSPAIISRPPLAVAISTGGTAPVLARLLRARIETAVPPGFGRLAGLAGRLQQATRERFPDLAARRRLLERLLSGPVAELVFAGREADAEALWRRALERDPDATGEAGSGQAQSGSGQAGGGSGPEPAFVHLLPVGSDEPDLLTLRALRVMGEADAIVHHPAESQAVLEVARRDASRHAVLPGAGPDRATAVLLRLAQAGGRIVRLRPAGDEAAALGRAGIAHATVPCVASR